MDDQDVVSYHGVPLGVPVLTRDDEQFGILEHVLEVPEVDVFDGIVVWTGGGKLVDKYIRHELKAGSRAGAVPAEVADVSGALRFVDADQIAVITTRYIRCAFAREQVALLPPPVRRRVISGRRPRCDRAEAAPSGRLAIQPVVGPRQLKPAADVPASRP